MNVRRQSFWDKERLKLRESLARLVCNVMRLADGMEQPTLFYAVTLTPALLGAGDILNTSLAWLYVGSLVAHSLVHALINVIMLRFAIFMAASFVLLAMTLRAAMIVY